MDGTELAARLVANGDEVFGIVRRNSVSENQDARLVEVGIADKVKTFYGDLTDPFSISKIISNVQPDHIYHLGAMSHVRISSDIPYYTLQTTAVGTLNVLEATREHCPWAKIYNAASSEMFGNNVEPDGSQNELTRMDPVSPYGCAKLLSYNLARHYRRAYGMFISNGILFNHESRFRTSNFVTAKITKTAAEIYLGLKKKLELGNLDACRDFGHSADYVRAMCMMLDWTTPDDFVIATGEPHSIREICEYVFAKLNLNYLDYVTINPKFFRPEELDYLCGDASKARKILGWEPQAGFYSILDEMLQYYLVKMTTRRSII
jgi:GDPmannose 4,6-dehydratase